MRTYSNADFQDYMVEFVQDIKSCEQEVDSQGMIIVKTFVFRWKDGSLHDEAEQ